MDEQKYFQEVVSLIEEKEINRRTRELQDNSDTLYTYWQIGKCIVKASGTRASYREQLVKKWGNKLSSLYGKKYDITKLRRMRQFYLTFPIWATVSPKLSWSHISEIITLQEENARNYYINQIILNNLSVRELRFLIKSNAYERLSNKTKIALITDKDKPNLTLDDMLKDPIIIKTNQRIDKLNEMAIHRFLINMVETKFLELGTGFALIGHEYKIIVGNKIFKIDLLFFNIELNRYIVIEVKNREFSPKDIGQIDFYVNYIDKNVKKSNHKDTLGIIVVKKKNQLVIEYVTNKIYITTFKVEETNL